LIAGEILISVIIFRDAESESELEVEDVCLVLIFIFDDLYYASFRCHEGFFV
jgi:hypothetical protein